VNITEPVKQLSFILRILEALHAFRLKDKAQRFPSSGLLLSHRKDSIIKHGSYGEIASAISLTRSSGQTRNE